MLKAWRFLNLDVPAFGDEAKNAAGPCARFDDVRCLDDVSAASREKVEGIVVRLGTTLDAAALSSFPALKLVASVTTGTDHIDMEHCARRGVDVISLRGETEFLSTITSTPEMTWGLLLALVRRIPWAFQSVLAGEWERAPYVGSQLRGKTLGLIGFGRIGKIVGRYAHAFEMKVLAYDHATCGSLEYPFHQVTLPELLSASDVISVHLPLTEETRHFLGAAELAQVGRGTWLINTARGAIVDETALLDALGTGLLAGAAIDVIEDETVPGRVSAQHPLVRYASMHDNLVIAPHISGSTLEAMHDTGIFVGRKLGAAVRSAQ